MILILACPFNAGANEIVYHDFKLSNGMQVVLVPNHKVPAVSHMVWYKVGAADEIKGKTGLAHLFEHLMFKATKNMKSGEFSSEVAKAGGNDNAFTHYDYTGYYQNISREKLPMVMQKEADRMKNLILNDEQLETEKLVVLEERRSRIENNPLAVLAEEMNVNLFSGHEYGRAVIGSQEDVKSVTKEDAQVFYEKYYAPNNAVLVVVGDISLDELKPLAKEYYGGLGVSEIDKRNIAKKVNDIKAKTITHQNERVKKAQWLRYYVAPQYSEDCQQCYALTLLSFLLGESRTSVLYKNLVVEKEIATSVDASYDDLSIGPAIFSISATPATGVKVEALEKEIEALIEQVKQSDFLESDVERAKQLFSAQVIYAQEDFTTMANIFGVLYSVGLDGSYVQKWEENIRSVTPMQIKLVAQKVLNNEKAITGLLLPKK